MNEQKVNRLEDWVSRCLGLAAGLFFLWRLDVWWGHAEHYDLGVGFIVAGAAGLGVWVFGAALAPRFLEDAGPSASYGWSAIVAGLVLGSAVLLLHWVPCVLAALVMFVLGICYSLAWGRRKQRRRMPGSRETE